MKIQIGVLMLIGLLGTSHAYAIRNEGYLAIVRGYQYDGTPETFKAHDCISPDFAETEAMNECMMEALSCERVETKRLYCNPVTLKCVC